MHMLKNDLISKTKSNVLNLTFMLHVCLLKLACFFYITTTALLAMKSINVVSVHLHYKNKIKKKKLLKTYQHTVVYFDESNSSFKYKQKG